MQRTRLKYCLAVAGSVSCIVSRCSNTTLTPASRVAHDERSLLCRSHYEERPRTSSPQRHHQAFDVVLFFPYQPVELRRIVNHHLEAVRGSRPIEAKLSQEHLGTRESRKVGRHHGSVGQVEHQATEEVAARQHLSLAASDRNGRAILFLHTQQRFESSVSWRSGSVWREWMNELPTEVRSVSAALDLEATSHTASTASLSIHQSINPLAVSGACIRSLDATRGIRSNRPYSDKCGAASEMNLEPRAVVAV